VPGVARFLTEFEKSLIEKNQSLKENNFNFEENF